MDLTIIREWLIQNGIPAEALDQTVEPEAFKGFRRNIKNNSVK
ncbi:hypothetical protein ACIQZI_03945 [Peribacillus sp. NPDC096379]